MTNPLTLALAKAGAAPGTTGGVEPLSSCHSPCHSPALRSFHACPPATSHLGHSHLVLPTGPELATAIWFYPAATSHSATPATAAERCSSFPYEPLRHSGHSMLLLRGVQACCLPAFKTLKHFAAASTSHSSLLLRGVPSFPYEPQSLSQQNSWCWLNMPQLFLGA